MRVHVFSGQIVYDCPAPLCVMQARCCRINFRLMYTFLSNLQHTLSILLHALHCPVLHPSAGSHYLVEKIGHFQRLIFRPAAGATWLVLVRLVAFCQDLVVLEALVWAACWSAEYSTSTVHWPCVLSRASQPPPFYELWPLHIDECLKLTSTYSIRLSFLASFCIDDWPTHQCPAEMLGPSSIRWLIPAYFGMDKGLGCFKDYLCAHDSR